MRTQSARATGSKRPWKLSIVTKGGQTKYLASYEKATTVAAKVARANSDAFFVIENKNAVKRYDDRGRPIPYKNRFSVGAAKRMVG